MKTIETIIGLVFFLSSIIYSVYIWGVVVRTWALFLPRHLGMAARELCHEIRPLVLVAIPLDTFHVLAMEDIAAWQKVLNTVLAMVYMAFALMDKDDRWKKRRKKLAAKVKEIGGKLVVVPVPAAITVGA